MTKTATTTVPSARKPRINKTKRCVLTLTSSEVTKFRDFCKRVNLPPAVLSHAVDDFLRDMNKVLNKVDCSKPVRLVDIFKLMGNEKCI